MTNVVVDITDVIDQKREAIKAYKSQLCDCDYSRVILGLNTYRSLVSRQGRGFAEGFFTADFDVYRGIYEAARAG
jgi:LmbE family N-acetylglucosaminyl deacetylase